MVFLMTAILTGVKWYISLWFWFAFPWWLVVLSIFSCVWGYLYVIFGKNVQVLCPLFNQVVCFLLLSYMSCLYSLDMNPLLVASFANIFFHSIDCLFVLSMVSFAVQKLLSLIRSHLFIFAFVSFALGDRSKKMSL